MGLGHGTAAAVAAEGIRTLVVAAAAAAAHTPWLTPRRNRELGDPSPI